MTVTPDSPPALTVARLGERYHRVHYAADPIAATADGVAGYDSDMPDPSREADDRLVRELGDISAGLATVDESALSGEDWLSHQTLSRLARDEQQARRHGLAEVAISASVAGRFPAVFSIIPLTESQAYRSRLSQVGEFFDRLGARHLQAAAEGRLPTALGVRQAIEQLDAYLSSPLDTDPLIRLGGGEIVGGSIRPALARYRDTLATHLLPLGRGDGEVGVCHVTGGTEGYRAAVRAHTTTELSPEEIHSAGEELVAGLRQEFAELGERTLGTNDASEVLRRLRNDPALRFRTSAEIVDTVTDALRRAEQAVADWFYGYDIAPCIVREMDPIEAENSVLGYYMPPAADGSRPGAHVINTVQPHLRPRYEYEALAFHESVPGHHLQIAIAQSLSSLPEFRRFAYLTAHGEGWGLYVERLCDEMGLYTDDLSRLGMVSFDAWRACRLVVDTGMHWYGWSRQRAIDYMRDNTALSDVNIANEVDRYIADPGQALGYMIGRMRLRELRQRFGADVKAFHHEVLGHGTLPLDTLEAHLARSA
jgi:uncharacterized protein (DUF885 family)